MAFELKIGNFKASLGFNRSVPGPTEKRGYPYDTFGMGWFGNLLWGEPSSANERVNELRAMRISTVYSCQKILAETLASMECNVHQRTVQGKKMISYQDPAQYLIHDAPNPNMTAYDFWYTLMLHASGWGTGYAVIKRDIYNEPTELDILCPWEVIPKTVEGQLFYVHKANTDSNIQSRTYSADELLIVKCFTLNGKVGVSPIRWNSETFGFNLKQQRYRGKAFGAKPPGYLQTANAIKKEDVEGIKQHWATQVTGDEVGGTPVLYNGLDYKTISFSPAELQLLEMSNATKEEICGIFRIPPTFVEDYERATFSNAEQQDMVFMKYTMLPWVTNIEQECNAKLFPSSNKTSSEPRFVKFNMDVFLRADYKTRTEGYRTLISAGVISIDEARQAENMDAIGEEWSGQHYMQMNMIPLDKMNDFIEKLKQAPAAHQQNGGDGSQNRSALDILIEKALLNTNGNGKH